MGHCWQGVYSWLSIFWVCKHFVISCCIHDGRPSITARKLTNDHSWYGCTSTATLLPPPQAGLSCMRSSIERKLLKGCLCSAIHQPIDSVHPVEHGIFYARDCSLSPVQPVPPRPLNHTRPLGSPLLMRVVKHRTVNRMNTCNSQSIEIGGQELVTAGSII